MSTELAIEAAKARPDSILYSVPVERAPAVAGGRVVLRAADPAAFAAAAPHVPVETVAWVQLIGVPDDPEAFDDWPEGVPVDVVLEDPANAYPALYRCATLIDRHPVRVTVPAVPGFAKAVKLAVSLHFAVKLRVGQPDPAVLEELSQVLDLYLHRATVDQPIEFFHSVLLATLYDASATLWQIQEDDPALFRFVTDAGEEAWPGRLTGAEAGAATPASFVAEHRAALLAAGGECASCPHLAVCGGYFKWPDPTYGCDGVKALLGTLTAAAQELATDMAAAAALDETEGAA
jgi:hypothetical protein